MDQDAFRKLLSSSSGSGASKQNGVQHAQSLLPSKLKGDQKKQSTDTSKATPSFKPRKAKKDVSSAYRDRAAERRLGVAGDFAEVESVLENFEKQHANEDKETVEEHRKYLGGDAEHSVLVKGLDFALLEQTKAHLEASEAAQDDEELEEAFRGVVAEAETGSASPLSTTSGNRTSAAKKRTREDILKDLKNKRARGELNANGEKALSVEEKTLDEAKKEGKFKPIGAGSGFKPIGNSSKSNDGNNVKRKKKKRKVVELVNEPSGNGGTQLQSTSANSSKEERTVKAKEDLTIRPPDPLIQPEPELKPEPFNEDFDIFADAGEYEGIDLGDGDDDEDEEERDKEDGVNGRRSGLDDVLTGEHADKKDENTSGPQPESRPTRRKWIQDDEDELPSPPREPSLSSGVEARVKPASSAAERQSLDADNEDELLSHSRGPSPTLESENQRLTRLAPLASSAVPSIRDILAADSALDAEQKRKARKEKMLKKRGRGGGSSEDESERKGKVSTEAKINRDYQKLKSYTAKKGGDAGL